MLYRGTAALEVWARRSVAGKVEVANLAEDWRDGRWVSLRTEICTVQCYLKEQRFSVFKVFSKSRDSQFSNVLLLQGLPGSLAPPPARVGGLEQDGGEGHDHQLHRGLCNCRGEQRWRAGLSVDVNFGKLGVKGKRLICAKSLGVTSTYRLRSSCILSCMQCQFLTPGVGKSGFLQQKNRLSLN